MKVATASPRNGSAVPATVANAGVAAPTPRSSAPATANVTPGVDVPQEAGVQLPHHPAQLALEVGAAAVAVPADGVPLVVGHVVAEATAEAVHEDHTVDDQLLVRLVDGANALVGEEVLEGRADEADELGRLEQGLLVGAVVVVADELVALGARTRALHPLPEVLRGLAAGVELRARGDVVRVSRVQN